MLAFTISALSFQASAPALRNSHHVAPAQMLAFRSMTGGALYTLHTAIHTEVSTDLIKQDFSTKPELPTEARKQGCGACTLCSCGKKNAERAAPPQMSVMEGDE